MSTSRRASLRAAKVEESTALDDPMRPAEVARPSARTHGVGASPIYQVIAEELRNAIAGGRYPLGARLPTEIELCRQFVVSRFTVRAAIRLLETAGLVTRRPRVGTTVIALPGDARYTHDASSVRDLLQYAQDTQLRLLYLGKLSLSRALAQGFGAKPGEEWIYALAVRFDGSALKRGTKATRPICITRLYLNPKLKGIETKLRERKTAVYALIEREYKISIQRVDQELQGVVLDADDAANLQCEPGSPALRIVRHYYSERGMLLEVADNIHPSDRFTYHMTLRR
jgi:DNA-binding GntR family transcriptional regulator